MSLKVSKINRVLNKLRETNKDNYELIEKKYKEGHHKNIGYNPEFRLRTLLEIPIFNNPEGIKEDIVKN